MSNIIEEMRRIAVNKLFEADVFKNCFIQWRPYLFAHNLPASSQEVIDLGDRLRDVFKQTGSTGRTQSSLSGGGDAWEALVCWYLNIVSIGRRTLIVRHAKALIPSAISDAITVFYNSTPSNTESDLLYVTVPDNSDFTKEIRLNNQEVPSDSKIEKLFDQLCSKHFSDLEVGIIQCKTNWNDNAQIPMLWNLIYQSKGFNIQGIAVGRNGRSIRNLKNFTYAFVTVPSNKIERIKINSLCVCRVRSLTGGNYWGMPTKSGIAASLKEFPSRNFATSGTTDFQTSIGITLPKLQSDYSYFKL